MGFSDFHGNSDVVHRLRDMLARGRFPQGVILAGPAGSGKYTLALKLAKSMNSLAPRHPDELPDISGQCANCIRIAQSEDHASHHTETVDARETLRETDTKETHTFI